MEKNKVILNIFEDMRLKLLGFKTGYVGFDNEIRSGGFPMSMEFFIF